MAKSKTTAIANYDERMAAAGAAAVEQESGVGGGSFYKTQGGQLSFDDAPIPGNQMAVIILDSVLENVLYEFSYDPDSPEGPTCFAFGRADSGMSPHEKVPTPVHESCGECPNNEWASADTGRGKAYSNRRRLALISAGTIDRDGSFEEMSANYTDHDVGYMSIPPTSLKSYAGYVKKVNAALKRPPLGVITKITLIPDSKTTFKTLFELIGLVAAEHLGVLFDRNETEKDAIGFPYTPREAEVPTSKRGKKAPKRKAPKRRAL